MPSDSLKRGVEHGLRATWDGDVALARVADGGLSDRTHVHRFRVSAAPAGSPASVIVKQPSQRDEHRALFFYEWACLQLLTELCAEPPAPRFYCGSGDGSFLVMEDFGTGDRLDHALLGDDAERATQMLVGLCETMGQMHAATFGHRARFDEILAEHGQQRLERDDRALERRRAAIESALTHLALLPDARFFDELAEVVRGSESPDVQALIHGDPCPDNCQLVGDRVRLLDFEHGKFGSVFSDGSYPLIHFPTCWCLGRVPERVGKRAVDAFRRALAQGMPQTADERTFERGMTDASILWAWSMFAGWHMPDVLSQDHEWGLATLRQRILFRFRLLVEMLERSGLYPGVAATTRRTREALAGRWKDVADVALYPAFR